MAGAGSPRRRPLPGGGFPCVQALRTPWTLEPPGSRQVMFQFPPVCAGERGRGWGVCPFALSRRMPPSPRVPSRRKPGCRGPSACVRDAPSEGTWSQQAPWPSATAQGEGGAQGVVPPLARVFHRRRRQFFLSSSRLCAFQSIPATCLPATARLRRLLRILASATLVASPVPFGAGSEERQLPAPPS